MLTMREGRNGAMKLIFTLTLLFVTGFAHSNPAPVSLISSDDLALTKSDHIIGEHIINIIKLTEKGYVNKGALGKVIGEVKNV